MSRNQYYRSQRGGRDHYNDRDSINLSELNFWNNKEKGIMNPDLFDRVAEETAKKISEAGRSKNKRSQIRKFFDEVVSLNQRTERRPEEFDKVLPMIKMLKPKVAYAQGRGLITESFQKLMFHCIDNVKTAEDLKVFAMFFEAFMGFYRALRND